MRKIVKIIKNALPVELQMLYRYLRAPYVKQSEELKKYVLVDVPNYGNIGDNAIAVSELDFLKKFIADDVSVFFVGDFYENIKWIKKNATKETIILLHGGGNVGTEYKYFEIIRQMICFLFPKNKIVLFPQTVDYGDQSIRENRKYLNNAKKMYNKHQNLIMCAREKVSYELMKEYFPKKKILLTPDIVLRYKADIQEKRDEKLVGFCFRNDSEKSMQDKDIEEIQVTLELKGLNVHYTDTAISGVLVDSVEKAENLVKAKIEELAHYKLVLTDRLHGMILCYLAKTPCIAFSNYNHKVKGMYEWVKNCGYIYYAENIEDASRYIEKVLGEEYQELNDGTDWEIKFEELITVLQ